MFLVSFHGYLKCRQTTIADAKAAFVALLVMHDANELKDGETEITWRGGSGLIRPLSGLGDCRITFRIVDDGSVLAEYFVSVWKRTSLIFFVYSVGLFFANYQHPSMDMILLSVVFISVIVSSWFLVMLVRFMSFLDRSIARQM